MALKFDIFVFGFTQEARQCLSNSALEFLHSDGYKSPTEAISVGLLLDSLSKHA